MIKGITPEGAELNLSELKIQHQNWLQHPETRMVIQALRAHAKSHTDYALTMSRLQDMSAESCKTQGAIAFNLNHVVDIISTPEMLFKLLNPESTNKQQ